MLGQDALKLIGKLGTIYAAGLTINVRITDVKVSYGRTRYQVEPISGSGSVWVESIQLANDAADGSGQRPDLSHDSDCAYRHKGECTCDKDSR